VLPRRRTAAGVAGRRRPPLAVTDEAAGKTVAATDGHAAGAAGTLPLPAGLPLLLRLRRIAEPAAETANCRVELRVQPVICRRRRRMPEGCRRVSAASWLPPVLTRRMPRRCAVKEGTAAVRGKGIRLQSPSRLPLLIPSPQSCTEARRQVILIFMSKQCLSWGRQLRQPHSATDAPGRTAQ